MDDIAIVGYGSLLPEADGSEAFWQNLLTARCSIRELPEGIWDCGHYFNADPRAADKSASPCAGFVAEAALARAARRLGLSRERFNRLQIMTLAAAEEALAPFRRPPSGAGRSALYLGCMQVDEDVSRRKFVADEWGSLRGHIAEFCADRQAEILSALWDRLGKWSPVSERDRPRLFTSSILSLLQERFHLPGEAALVDAGPDGSAKIDFALPQGKSFSYIEGKSITLNDGKKTIIISINGADLQVGKRHCKSSDTGCIVHAIRRQEKNFTDRDSAQAFDPLSRELATLALQARIDDILLALATLPRSADDDRDED